MWYVIIVGFAGYIIGMFVGMAVASAMAVNPTAETREFARNYRSILELASKNSLASDGLEMILVAERQDRLERIKHGDRTH